MTFVRSAARVTDGGLETDLIYHRGLELADFAAFPLLEHDAGRGHLADYYGGYADVARRAGAALLLEAPTWRANPDWGARLGYDAGALRRANTAAIAFLKDLRQQWPDIRDVAVSGVIGPRGDGYVAGDIPDTDEAADYHRPQIETFAAADADLVHAMTITSTAEAQGIIRAANDVGIPVAVSFTVEVDATLPDGTALGEAIKKADAGGDAMFFGVNCAYPTHIARGLSGQSWQERIGVIRCNASSKTRAELDAAEELDEGDIPGLRDAFGHLRAQLPRVHVIGGCCGTDARHVAALWGL
ncbi:MAG TPA: homocysteine S-methyltransferase family protein [Micromonosporaceae bacterium]|nr:homocysteine S-methyltransferase family protein [Micromonosporaceae bacterium]